MVSANFDGSVTYALDRSDSDAVRATVNAMYGKQARLMLPIGVATIALGAVRVGLGFASPRHYRFWDTVLLGWPQIFFGIMYVLMATRPRFLIVRRPRVGVLSTLVWNRRGLSFGLAGKAAIMTIWAGVSRLEVSESVLQIHRRWKPAIVVPRRAFADDGNAFVAYVEDRIVGKRLLVRASAPGVPSRAVALRSILRRERAER